MRNEVALGILEEQVLGVAARQRALDLGALGHRVHGRVLDGANGDAQLGEALRTVLHGLRGAWRGSERSFAGLYGDWRGREAAGLQMAAG